MHSRECSAPGISACSPAAHCISLYAYAQQDMQYSWSTSTKRALALCARTAYPRYAPARNSMSNRCSASSAGNALHLQYVCIPKCCIQPRRTSRHPLYSTAILWSTHSYELRGLRGCVQCLGCSHYSVDIHSVCMHTESMA